MFSNNPCSWSHSFLLSEKYALPIFWYNRNVELESQHTWEWLCQSFMAVLPSFGAFQREDRLFRFTPQTAEPCQFSPPDAVVEPRNYFKVRSRHGGRGARSDRTPHRVSA